MTRAATPGQRAIPVIVAYHLPDRDACGHFSAASGPTAAGYQTWISQLAAAIGDSDAIVVVEPDAVPDILASYLDPAQRAERYRLLRGVRHGPENFKPTPCDRPRVTYGEPLKRDHHRWATYGFGRRRPWTTWRLAAQQFLDRQGVGALVRVRSRPSGRSALQAIYGAEYRVINGRMVRVRAAHPAARRLLGRRPDTAVAPETR